MPEIVEAEAGQTCFLRQCPPCRSPAIDMLCGVEFREVGPDNLFAMEDPSRDIGRKDVMLRLYLAERFRARR